LKSQTWVCRAGDSAKERDDDTEQFFPVRRPWGETGNFEKLVAITSDNNLLDVASITAKNSRQTGSIGCLLFFTCRSILVSE